MKPKLPKRNPTDPLLAPVVVPAPAIITAQPRTRWHRDGGVGELIRYFDQPERANNWGAISKKERAIIVDEIQKCQRDFAYAARNYFWLRGGDKQSRDTLFFLWESQELILEKLYWLKSRGRAQKLMTIKARQLGVSSLVEALIAWQTMFFPNRTALVVSHVEPHAQYLFSIMTHFYDMMPWWLKPMLDKRTYDEGIHFQNPDEATRRENPGLNSMVIVQSATSITGVGQGIKVTAAHVSEFASYEQRKAKEIIEGDMVYALADNPVTFAVLESTAKGAGTYAEKLWLANVELAEKAEWYPLFLPWFFEKTRVIAPERSWQPEKPEEDMRERVERDWVRCDNERCGEWRESHFLKQPLAETVCQGCKKGVLHPYRLTDPQLRFMWEQRINKEKKGPDALKELRQELASTSEESFQLSGMQVFPQDTIDFAIACLAEPIAVGDLDSRGHFHGVNWSKANKDLGKYPCHQEWCTANHRWETDQPLKIWEFPKKDVEYVVGVDVAEGLGGEADYSVAWVNRIGGMGPDVHVATYRSNTITAAEFAAPVNFLGRWYNDALMSIEYNTWQTVGDLVRVFYQYPNVYRWKHPDNVNMVSQRWHWITQANTKPRLWQTAVMRLRQRIWIVRDPEFVVEIKRFQKEDYSDRHASAERGWHDDVAIAAMIALYTSHDLDWDENYGTIPAPPTADARERLETSAWRMRCLRCREEFGADNPEEFSRCPACGCRMLSGRRRTMDDPSREVNFAELGERGPLRLPDAEYDVL